ncbi:DUF3616 domain-containing protein [Thalassobaculum salexigens]|uniref:DUF3616 domain-containing protein n=1 Tax=Thalassobaculum salexigens TaxID=455360 RepID=UPI0003F56ADB|nr:DUF3616 domain-containing protein [Thalassobaculum salexigens]
MTADAANDAANPDAPWPTVATPRRRVRLDFQHHADVDAVFDPVRQDLSALAVLDRSMWLACDETTTIEQLTRTGGARWSDHQTHNLHEAFDLHGDEGDEIDIEGLAIDDGWLWITGSHGLTRKKPKWHENDPAVAMNRLTEVKSNVARRVIGRLPLVDAGNGTWMPSLTETEDGRRPSSVRLRKGRTAFTKSLAKDIHLGRFMDIPCKENGFDIEGIAARGDRVLLGLRGPVLRGWAVILELRMKMTKSGHLKPRRIGPDGERYRKYFIDLEGLGIRDLQADGDDLLILAGPTMDLDGPVALIRWPGAWTTSALKQAVIPYQKLERVLDLPYGYGTDHAEGIALTERSDGGRELMVVYDSPAQGRLSDETAIRADLFAID